jgi:hypothetical protein
LTTATDHALTEAIREIEELHRHYDEQEQVIKDRYDLIAELLVEVDSEDDSDSDSNLTMMEMMMEELLRTLRRIQRSFLREMPLKSRCPSQSRCLKRSHRRSHTRWSSPRLIRRSYPRPPQCQHHLGFLVFMHSYCRMSLRIHQQGRSHRVLHRPCRSSH